MLKLKTLKLKLTPPKEVWAIFTTSGNPRRYILKGIFTDVIKRDEFVELLRPATVLVVKVILNERTTVRM